MQSEADSSCLHEAFSQSENVLQSFQRQDQPLIPEPNAIAHAESKLFGELPEHGTDIKTVTRHLLNDISPALNAGSLSPNYYGFVTGGVTPAARIGEGIVSLYDQNAAVHLPQETVASTVEHRALKLLLDLLAFDPDQWNGVFTTGATASNILGLALGREAVINQAVAKRGELKTVGEHGLLEACAAAELTSIDIYTSMPHSSIVKAASIVGIGRLHVHDIAISKSDIRFDLDKLEQELSTATGKSAAIVAISCGEVNTGAFATDGFDSMKALRQLCDRHGAWLHADGAFGIFARVLDGMKEFEELSKGVQGLELADSITGDGHKMLNVPYDCGFFFSRSKTLAEQVFQNANAAYLNSSSNAAPSPLNIGIENSRRFRALPVYASLVCYGKSGYRDMLVRQVTLARRIASFLIQHEAFELLPHQPHRLSQEVINNVCMIVLFRAKNATLNSELVSKINMTRKMYVSGTKWDDLPASRIAIANWQVDVQRDLKVVQDVLEAVAGQ